jgi:hypothetical protein
MRDTVADFRQRSEEFCKHFFDRTPVRAVAPRTDGPAVVVRRVEVTAALGQPLSGYGITFTRHARGWMHPQYATLILMDDGAGARTLIVGFDLHAATRWVAESIARVTGPAIGVGIDRLFVTATHSHAGGGNFYGVQFYDHMVTNLSDRGFDDRWPAAIVKRVTDAASAMAADIEAGAGRNPRLGFGVKCVWGPIWQRALTAHVANFGEVADMDEATMDKAVRDASFELNDERPPDGTPIRRVAVDARVRCLTWESDGQPMAVLAFMGVTPTMFHANAQIAGGDGLGYAARYAEEKLTVAAQKPVYVSANGSAHGDTFLGKLGSFEKFTEEREEAWKKWDTLAPFAADVVENGARIGAALATAITRARTASAGGTAPGANNLSPVPGSVHFSEDPMAGAQVRCPELARNAAPLAPGKSAEDPADARLGEVGVVGDGMLGGDPLEPGTPEFLVPRNWPTPKSAGDLPFKLDRSVRKTFDASDPQSPKTASLAAKLADKLDGPEFASFSPWCTLRALHFPAKGPGRGLTLIGVPFEPTTRATYEIERAVLANPALRPDRAVLACLSGDYLGYLVTREEYMTQMYEGGSSWFGRNVHRWVKAKVLETLQEPPTVRFKRAWFTSKVIRVNPKVLRGQGLTGPDKSSGHWTLDTPETRVGPDGARWLTLRGSWSAAMDTTPHERAGGEAWLRLHLRANAGATPALARLPSGAAADDKSGWITLFRDVVAGETFVRWRWQFHAPLPAAWSGQEVTFQVVSALPGVVPLQKRAVFVKIP